MKVISKKSVALIIPLTIQVLLLIAFGMLHCAYADKVTNNLATEIQAGRITIDQIEGTGGSTGTVLNGYLINNTKKEINLDVFLRDALYLLNSGRGQNMFVLGVLGKSGRYVRSGKKSFITLPSKKRTPVIFLSYCVDFEKENPSPSESFELGTLPENMKSLLRRIVAYHEQYPNKDITRAAQLAIWLAQGESASEIKSKFGYTQSDLNLAYRLMDK
jgi:hypothetical protein